MFHILCALVDTEEGGKEAIVAQFPHDEIEIVDDWHVMGMKGTGSNTIVLRDGETFVPEHRVARTIDMFSGKRPAPQPAGILYRIGLEQFAQLAAKAREAAAGVPQTPLDTARIRTGSAYVCMLAADIANMALRASGASSIQTTNPLQRIMRDITTVTLNGQMNIETAYEDYGRLIAGLPGFGGPKKNPAVA